MQGIANNQSNQASASRSSTIDVPVRILVPSESVGAIIGKGGQTIRQLTQQTRAKVDVYRGDPMAPSTALQEKVITIRGQPENCINACREILKVMKVDAESKGKPSDMPLKVLAHNDYIGRIIGKQGNIINTIKKETDTSVTVSSINDMSMNVERVITVKGELENMIKALEIIHTKVKQAFENDTKTYGAQAIMMGGIPPLPLAPPAFAAAHASSVAAAAAAAAFNAPNPAARYAAAAAAAAAAAQQQQHQQQHGGHQSAANNSSSGQSGSQSASLAAGSSATTPSGAAGSQGAQQGYSSYYQPIYQQGLHNGAALQYANPLMPPPQSQLGLSQQQQQSQELLSQLPEPETVYLYIPNVAVGAIIGTKGSFIKNIIKLSGASVKITPLSPEESKTALERQVVIMGSPESQWKAQYYIYEKIRQERFTTDENVKLRAELQVPSQIVGRIIGKSGKNVRELQRTTGATIKLPEDAAAVASSGQQAGDAAAASSDASAPAAAATNGEATTAASPSAPSADAATADASAAASTHSDSKPESPSPSSQANLSSAYVTVRIFGSFQASQLAQRRIQSLVSQSRGIPVEFSAFQVPPRVLGNVTNYQAFQMPLANSFNHRGEYMAPPPHHQHQYQHQHQHQQPQRINGSAYVRRQRQQQQQQQQQSSTGSNKSINEQQPQQQKQSSTSTTAAPQQQRSQTPAKETHNGSSVSLNGDSSPQQQQAASQSSEQAAVAQNAVSTTA